VAVLWVPELLSVSYIWGTLECSQPALGWQLELGSKLNPLPGVMVYSCNANYSRDRGKRISSSKPVEVKIVRFCVKNKIQTKGLGAWFKW
jgi:hypothetical protein